MSQLPDTVTFLGLSISSAEESRAVSALKTWQGLDTLSEWREMGVAGLRDYNIIVNNISSFCLSDEIGKNCLKN